MQGERGPQGDKGIQGAKVKKITLWLIHSSSLNNQYTERLRGVQRISALEVCAEY